VNALRILRLGVRRDERSWSWLLAERVLDARLALDLLLRLVIALDDLLLIARGCGCLSLLALQDVLIVLLLCGELFGRLRRWLRLRSSLSCLARLALLLAATIARGETREAKVRG
jgi:hypothetical protein